MHEDPNRDQKQAVAMCFSQWRRESMHADFERILKTFLSHYGESGLNKFEAFIQLNKLKVDRAYTPQAQFKESFSWVEPLIQSYKEDKDAKYYKIIALTANISMNNNDYSDYDKMQQAASSLTYRPVNLNHDHNTWLPFPRTRIDFTKAEDMSVEGTLRVDNQDKWLQDRIDRGDIAQVSIEGRPEPEGMNQGYHFTGLALLERGVELPGDPLTEIQPLFLNESVGKAVCKLIDGQLICCKGYIGETKLQESEKTIMSTQISKEAELPATGKCVCPMCGQVDPLNEKECSLQKCSRDSCGHQMQTQTDRAAKKETSETIPLVEHEAALNKVKADLTEEITKLTTENITLKTEDRNQKENYARANDRIAELMTENKKIQIFEEQKKALENKIVILDDEKDKLRGQNETYASQIGDLEKEKNKAYGRASELKEKIAGLETENEKVRREYNEESAKRAASEQKALNETKERSRIQLENADLRNEVAKTTREISKLTETLAEDAKKIYMAENEKKALVTKLAEKDAELTKKEAIVKKALKFQSWAWKELQKSGIAVVESTVES
jgi:hypothetical protein